MKSEMLEEVSDIFMIFFIETAKSILFVVGVYIGSISSVSEIFHFYAK